MSNSENLGSAPSYADAGYPIRNDLHEIHRTALGRIAQPGTWWSAADRVRIAQESRAARDCALCTERKAALSPSAVTGQHDGPGTLDPAIVDAIHRIVTDPGRLTKSFYETLCSDGPFDREHASEQYVELVAVSVFLNALDVFARAIGVASAPIPVPVAGEPSRVRPASARVIGAWVPQIPSVEEGGGEDWKALYAGWNNVPQIGRALSLVPDEVEMLKALSGPHYMDIENAGDPNYAEPGRSLGRSQMELIASRVSAINECFY